MRDDWPVFVFLFFMISLSLLSIWYSYTYPSDFMEYIDSPLTPIYMPIA